MTIDSSGWSKLLYVATLNSSLESGSVQICSAHTVLFEWLGVSLSVAVVELVA